MGNQTRLDAPFALSVDSGGDQFAVTGPAPRLSWKLPRSTETPDAYELEAMVDRMPQGTARSTVHRFTAWPWAPLRSRQCVEWRVRTVTSGATSAWSDWAAFEVGLLEEDWIASWISPVEDHDPGYASRPAHALATEFTLGDEVRTARLYATALGVYTATLNGARVGTAELAPGSTSYDRTLYAQAWDVTEALTPGRNHVELELSDGWYRGQVGAFRLPAGWGTVLGARAELHVELQDGTHRVVRTDGTWTSRPSVTTRADLMDGQTVDFTATLGPERPVRVDRVSAPPIEWSPAPPVRTVETRAPQAVQRLRDDVWIVDFGQNASGWIRLTDLGPSGTRTVIDYGEHLGPDGDLTTAHLDSERPGEPSIAFVQRDEVIAGPEPATFEPRHTVHGFRYARVVRSGASLDPTAIVMQIVHTDLQRTGTFACSDGDLNRLHEIADWSFRGNAVDVPTDCPTRERLAWTGDYQVFASTATRLYDVLGFSRKWLRSVRDDQLDDGRIANFSPDGRRIKHHLDDQFAMMTGSAGWGDAIVAVPWELYESYGDEKVLAENWDAMVRWVEWALHQARTTRHHARVQRSPEPEPFEEYLWDGTFHWGEWTEPKARDADGNRIDPIKHDPMAWFMADKGEVGTAYLFRSTSTLARAASVLGRPEEAARYERTADRIRRAWRGAYLHADGTTAADTQASYVRALSFGLVPDELRQAGIDRLVSLIRAAGTHLGTGFLATGDLLPVLADNGRADVAYEVLFQRSAPSWLAMLDRGATTIWEDWDGIDELGAAHDSLNHYSKGAVIRFLHTHTLGLKQDAESVAWDRVVIAPVPGPSLTWARGTHESPNGTLAVEWRVEDGGLRITADIPASTVARIEFPDGTRVDVGPGRFDARRPLPGLVPAMAGAS